MDDESDEVMAPMVDALTGAMSAILLVSIFLMISTISVVPESVKEYGKIALTKNSKLFEDIFDRTPPILDIKNFKISFYKIYKFTDDQLVMLKNEFVEPPSSIDVYSSDKSEVVTYNLLSFMSQVGLIEDYDNITINFHEARESGLTEIFWSK
ncbi:hypothetical protein [Grimontia hollisae]|uniref:hypothetical protein n=1 Tax=Grimontia hollisae TaxID=673 RepID=UPI0012ACB035|nr:hypothetical protein [Grimontia hollisae]